MDKEEAENQLRQIYKDLDVIGLQKFPDSQDEYLVMWNNENGSTKAIHVKLVNSEWEEQ